MKKNITKKTVAAKAANNANINPKTGKPYSARQLTAIKNGTTLGRKPGANSTMLISLEDLNKQFPATAKIPVGMVFLRKLNLDSTAEPFVATNQNLKSIADSYKTQTQATIVDLNESAEKAETLATV